ncbi:phosphatase PAP2 family protein [Streptomyces sp. NPDC085540]|uniref:phosphatase PAP2 family protein n=1 Tax=Streptomyces sp. NPDC085540 TaxID=3365730 RepID=UPI0037CDB677
MTFTPPAPPAFADCTPRQKVARILSDVLAPAHLVVALLLFVGWHGTTAWTGLGWGLFAACFCGVVPIGIIALGVRRGALTDQHVRVRRQRLVPMALSLVSVLAGVTLLHLLGAPREVFALVVAMLVGLVSSLLVTLVWQISIHMSVAGGAVMILLLVLGPRVLPAVLIAAAVAWSRLVLEAHTPAQLLAGTALGGTAALTFALLG